MKKLVSIITCSVAALGLTALVSCNVQNANVPKVQLQTAIDSLSYAQGVGLSQEVAAMITQDGLEEYKEDFIKGFKEGTLVKEDDKKTAAKMMGMQIGNQLSNKIIKYMNESVFGADSTATNSLSNEMIYSGFIATLLDKDILMSKEDAQTVSTTIGQKLQEEAFEKANAQAKADNLKFLEENKAKEGVVALPSGLQYKVIKEGNGAKPVATNEVSVHYHGTTIDGTVFDSSVERGTPASFGLNHVIPGWTEGLQYMPVGSKYILYIPYDLAYGAQGRPGSIPPYATLIFEVELLEILK